MAATSTRHIEVFIQSVQLTGTDTGSGVDAGEAIAFSATELGAGVDTETITVTLSDSDAGSATDTESVNTDDSHPSDSDTGTSLDAEVSANATVTASDTGSGIEAGTIVAGFVLGGRANVVATSWTFGTHLGEVVAGRTSAVIATRAPLVLGPLQVASSDTGTGVDSGTIAAPLTDADTGSGVEAETVFSSTLIFGADSGAGTESELLAADVADTDLGATIDAEYLLLVALSDFENGSGVDGGELVTVIVPPLVPHIHGTATNGRATTIAVDGTHTLALQEAR